MTRYPQQHKVHNTGITEYKNVYTCWRDRLVFVVTYNLTVWEERCMHAVAVVHLLCHVLIFLCMHTWRYNINTYELVLVQPCAHACTLCRKG